MDIIEPKSKNQMKWNGWGYANTSFQLNENGAIELSGDRYLFSGREFPMFRAWAEEKCGLDVNFETPAQRSIAVPKPIENAAFLEEAANHCEKWSMDAQDRLDHAHGHTLQEVFLLRRGHFERVPDAVIWPSCHDDVEQLVAAAVRHNVVLIPFGGGTSVTQALMCPTEERRMIVSLDMRCMNRILWLDEDDLMMRVEAGAVGKELEAELAKRGFRLGHEPDSYEFSTVGGWVATRASGMKKSVYGNIEDMLQSVRVVTPAGTLEKGCVVPRESTGPSVMQMVLGSEGTLGVVTECVFRIRRLPEVQEYGSIVFPSFEQGVACLHELVKRQIKPASIRLVDNTQFQFGQVLKPGGESLWSWIADGAKKFYITKVKGFKVDRMVAATLVFEGSREQVQQEEEEVYTIAAKYHGMKAGAANGVRGYFLTYCIAYIRDYGLDYDFVAESFETSVAWSRILRTVDAVRKCIEEACTEHGVLHAPFISCRVTQSYDTGACLYFYYGVLTRGLDNPLTVFSTIEDSARDVLLENGASLSHHHGVGKLRRKWMTQTTSPVGMRMLAGLKDSVDPQNIFGANNLLDRSDMVKYRSKL